MSKGNPFLGFARGAVGDVVLTRSAGEQVTRARNRSPRNPQTPLQLVQRSILKTVSSAYSALQEITDHSFEGLQLGTENQSRFQKLNIAMLRGLASEDIASADPVQILNSEASNYMGKYDTYPVLNAYTISEGTLPVMSVLATGNSLYISIPGTDLSTDPSYEDVAAALGLQQGDQLTFIFAYGDDSDEDASGYIKRVEVSRVILDPDDGNMTDTFWNDVSNTIGNPNPRNSGRIYFTFESQGQMGFRPSASGYGQPGGSDIIIGAAAIVSRPFAGKWRRSSQVLVPRQGLNNTSGAHTLGEAVRSFHTEPASSLYLNQGVNLG